jgi:hypothetical protein
MVDGVGRVDYMTKVSFGRRAPEHQIGPPKGVAERRTQGIPVNVEISPLTAGPYVRKTAQIPGIGQRRVVSISDRRVNTLKGLKVPIPKKSQSGKRRTKKR